jgi:hypothetical protein
VPEVLNLHQLAERLGIDANWIRTQAEAGKLPYLPASNRMLFNPAAVITVLASMAATFPTGPTRPRRTKAEESEHAA